MWEFSPSRWACWRHGNHPERAGLRVGKYRYFGQRIRHRAVSSHVTKPPRSRMLWPHGSRAYPCTDFLVKGYLSRHANRYGKPERNRFIDSGTGVRFPLNLEWERHISSYDRGATTAPAAGVHCSPIGLIPVRLIPMRSHPEVVDVDRVQNSHSHGPVSLATRLYRRQPGERSCYVVRLRSAPDCRGDRHRYVYASLAGQRTDCPEGSPVSCAGHRVIRVQGTVADEAPDIVFLPRCLASSKRS